FEVRRFRAAELHLGRGVPHPPRLCARLHNLIPYGKPLLCQLVPRTTRRIEIKEKSHAIQQRQSRAGELQPEAHAALRSARQLPIKTSGHRPRSPGICTTDRFATAAAGSTPAPGRTNSIAVGFLEAKSPYPRDRCRRSCPI